MTMEKKRGEWNDNKRNEERKRDIEALIGPPR